MSMLKVLTRFSRRFAPRGMPAFFAALFAFALLAPPEAEAQQYQGASVFSAGLLVASREGFGPC